MYRTEGTVLSTRKDKAHVHHPIKEGVGKEGHYPAGEDTKKPLREIIRIDEEKCDGCSLCIPACPEGALQVIDGKARLISDLFCDGLGACIGECPRGAIRIIKREAEPYDERKVMERIVGQGSNVIKAHLQHLRDHNQEDHLEEALAYLEERGVKTNLEGKRSDKSGQELCGCLGSRVVDLRDTEKISSVSKAKQESELRQWPVQLRLVPTTAPYFDNADLAIVADCVPFAYANFHQDVLRGKSIVVGCPKLDDAQFYLDKLAQLFQHSSLKTVTVVMMEVPCCLGLNYIVQEALKQSGKNIPLKQMIIGVKGERKE
ncbi:MAG: ATP-binding protein [Candidatus Hodarchaeota archaeon]